IRGFRGIKSEINFHLNSKSLLLFGENGSGKSSITDAIEWFYYDSVKHLSTEEIDRKGGITALRNIHISDTDESSVNIEFDNSQMNCKKELSKNKNGNLETNLSNQSEEFKNYLLNSKKEQLILRYSDLTKFVLSTKAERLKFFSEIIGFEDLNKTREVLRKGVNHVKQKLKQNNYENQISNRESQILNELGERITSDEEYVKKINELIQPLGYRQVTAFKDIPHLLEQLKERDDSQIIEKRLFYDDTIKKITDLQNTLPILYEGYKNYYEKYNEIISKAEDLKNILLADLWQKGLDILNTGIFEPEKCPLCFQEKLTEELIREIEERLQKVEIFKKKQAELEERKKSVERVISNIEQKIKISNKYLDEAENKEIQKFIETVTEYDNQIKNELKKDFLKSENLKTPNELHLPEETISKTIDFCESKFKELGNKLKGNKTLEVRDKILRTQQTYEDIKKLKSEKEKLEYHLKSLEKIYNAFIQKQKMELENFIGEYSKKISEYYSYLHPGENVENIAIQTIEEDDELKGLTMEFEFFNRRVSPPNKYLSESHLNSLGIVLFLCSVEAFNKINKFFILDDIISSFDVRHRKRLGELLLEKFNDYQIIIFTHEQNWFDYMKSLVKGKGNSNWLIKAVKWTEEKGTCLDESHIDLKNRIEFKIANGDTLELPNLMRRYLEGILKTLCEKLEVYVKYLSNERNELRMSDELLSNLQSKINKQPDDTKSKLNPVIDKIKASIFIANRGSHDSSFQPSTGDCRAFWDEIKKFESLYFCDQCNKSISIEFLDSVSNKIRCKCGKLSYDWKR
ncbi:MAG: AAA family ATPase, partial [Candidatus Ratteibacteria bacterium]